MAPPLAGGLHEIAKFGSDNHKLGTAGTWQKRTYGQP